MTRALLFLTASARPASTSLHLAQAAASGLPQDCAARWLDLHAMDLPPFQDLRPAVPQPLTPALQTCLDAIRAATGIVFVAPIYWYALPAPLHLLLSHWSGWLDDPALGFKVALNQKPVWLITARADPAPEVPLLAEAMLKRSADWLGMRWSGALHGVGDSLAEMEADPVYAQAPRFLTGIS